MEIIKLNLIPSGVNPTCHCSQYDNGRVIRIDLFDGLTPYVLQSGDTVTLNVRKPDNTIVTTSLTATQGNTYVNLVTTEQICACVGYNLCDLTITNGSVVIGTLNFIMQVERDVLANGIPSQSVIEDLDALVQEAVGDQYYTKTEVDDALDLKADKSTTYTKTQVDSALALKADASTVYTKSQTDAALALKADANDVYTINETNDLLYPKMEAVFDYDKIYNIMPPDCQFTLDSSVKTQDGTIISNTGYVATDYIPIDADKEYLCNYVNVRVLGDSNLTDGYQDIYDRIAYAFYDKNKTFVASTSSGGDVSKKIPSTAKYVRLTLKNKEVIPYAILFYGNYSTRPFVRYTKYRRQVSKIQTYGYTGYENLKMVMFGDSITHGDLGISDDGTSYTDYANDILRGDIINCGLGGTRMSQGSPTGIGLGSFASLCENIVSDDANAWADLEYYATNSNPTWIPHVTKLKEMDWSTVQAIGILYGANDWNNNVPIGNQYNEDPTTYDGACAYGLNLLLTKYPHLQVLLLTPFYRKVDDNYDSDMENSAGNNMSDYARSLIEHVQPTFHIPLANTCNELGLNRYTVNVYTNDGTHIRNNKGLYRFGRFFAEAVKRYIQPY